MMTSVTRACTALAVLAATALLPPSGSTLPPEPHAPPAATGRADAPASGSATAAQAALSRSEAIQAALDQPIPELLILDVSLRDAIDYFTTLMPGIDVHVYWRDLENSGVDPAATVITLRAKAIPARRALRLILDQASGGDVDLDYEVRDGMLLIGTSRTLDGRPVTNVYAVGDLLVGRGSNDEAVTLAASPHKRARIQNVIRTGLADVIGEVFRAQDLLLTPSSAASKPTQSDVAADESRTKIQHAIQEVLLKLIHEQPGDALTGQLADEVVSAYEQLAGPLPVHEQLQMVIQDCVEPDSWESAGGRGRVRVFNDLLVVRQTPHVQRQVEQLLNDLRAANTAARR